VRSVGIVISVLAFGIVWVLFPRTQLQSPLEYFWASLLVGAFSGGAISGIGLVLAPKRFRIPAYVFLGVWLLMGIALFLLRVHFVFAEGGSDQVADSPLGFLTGAIFHQLVTTVPATFLLLWLHRASRRQESRYQNVVIGSPDAV
jgi:hypothetical protein